MNVRRQIKPGGLCLEMDAEALSQLLATPARDRDATEQDGVADARRASETGEQL